jgi:hypothetical protein
MCGAIMAWDLVKHRHNFTFTHFTVVPSVLVRASLQDLDQLSKAPMHDAYYRGYTGSNKMGISSLVVSN